MSRLVVSPCTVRKNPVKGFIAMRSGGGTGFSAGPPGAKDPARPVGACQISGWGLSSGCGLRHGGPLLMRFRQGLSAGRDGSHRVEREHAAALQLSVLVLLQQHRTHQAGDGRVVGEDADNAGAPFDLLVHPLEQVGAPELAPVTDWEVAEGQHVIAGRGHEICRPWELGGEHGGHLIPLLLHGGGALLGEYRAQGGGHHLLLSFRHGLQEVAGKVHAGALPGAALEHAAHGFGRPHVSVAHHQPHAAEAALYEAGEELPPEGLALAVAHLEPQQLTAAIGIDAHGDDDGPGADLQRLAEPAVEVGGVEVEVRVTAAVERPLQEGLDLGIKALADAAHLRAGDAGLGADRLDQGVNFAGGDTLDPGLHDHGVQGLIDPSPGLQDRGEEAAGAEFGDREREVAHLGGEQAWPAAVAVAPAFLAALVAVGPEHGGDLQLDQLLQAVARQLGDQLPSGAAIQ
jgi:hypothetical protein